MLKDKTELELKLFPAYARIIAWMEAELQVDCHQLTHK